MLEPMTPDGMAINVAALRINYETLTSFKKQVDDALKTLDASPASNGKVSEQTLSRTSYGNGFTEADDLSVAYEQAHQNLQDLSKSLSDQLEALSLAIDCSHKGASDTDEKHAQRLRQLYDSSRTSYDRHQKKHGHQDQSNLGHDKQAEF